MPGNQVPKFPTLLISGGGGGSFSDRPVKMKKTENLVKRVG